MPIPKPHKNENQKDFTNRCMSDEVMLKDYKDNKQRYAVCMKSWENNQNRMNYEELQERSLQDYFNENTPKDDFKLRAVESDNGEKSLEGTAVVYNSESVLLMNSFREIIEPGAFDEILMREDLDVVLLLNHNSDNIMARTTNGTLKINSDENGLHYRAILPDTQLARDVYELVSRGDLYQNSFAFLPAKDGYSIEDRDDGTQLVKVNKIEKFRDVSVVTNPAYKATRVKARNDEETQDNIPDENQSLELRFKLLKIKNN